MNAVTQAKQEVDQETSSWQGATRDSSAVHQQVYSGTDDGVQRLTHPHELLPLHGMVQRLEQVA